MRLSIQIEDVSTESAAQLIAALDAELLILNPRLSKYAVGLGAGDLAADRGAFLVARVAAEPVGCGAVTLIDPRVAEIKRMYVVPSHRNLGSRRASSRHLSSRPSRSAPPRSSWRQQLT